MNGVEKCFLQPKPLSLLSNLPLLIRCPISWLLIFHWSSSPGFDLWLHAARDQSPYSEPDLHSQQIKAYHNTSLAACLSSMQSKVQRFYCRPSELHLFKNYCWQHAVAMCSWHIKGRHPNLSLCPSAHPISHLTHHWFTNRPISLDVTPLPQTESKTELLFPPPCALSPDFSVKINSTFSSPSHMPGF